ncbi:MAG: hypothetical protein M3O22_09160 [Pseudomonadota bacterium]|nr:hypothetical protein [Pseudomonadota bacterium]
MSVASRVSRFFVKLSAELSLVAAAAGCGGIPEMPAYKDQVCVAAEAHLWSVFAGMGWPCDAAFGMAVRRGERDGEPSALFHVTCRNTMGQSVSSPVCRNGVEAVYIAEDYVYMENPGTGQFPEDGNRTTLPDGTTDAMELLASNQCNPNASSGNPDDVPHFALENR